MQKRPLILVTNDDGYYSKGIKALVEIVKPLGDIVVVAPDRNSSGQSHSVTFKYPIYLNQNNFSPDVTSYHVSGTPVDCVKIALHKILDRKPDIVLAGINDGSNASINVVYSGTMACVIEGCLHQIPSVGFSQVVDEQEVDFYASKKYILKITQNIIENGLPKGVCLNVNLPPVKDEEIAGIKICRQTPAVWKEDFAQRKHPRGGDYFWLMGDFVNFAPNDEDTDIWAIENKYIAIVPLKTDMTDYETIKTIKNWDL